MLYPPNKARDMDKEFQEAKRQYTIAIRNNNKNAADDAIATMRGNLLSRNKGVEEYVLSYTEPGLTKNINSGSIEDLSAIDGDMNPQGI